MRRPYMWKVWILGYALHYVPDSRAVYWYGPQSGAAWPLACRLARRLGADVRAERPVLDFGGEYARAHPGPTPVPAGRP